MTYKTKTVQLPKRLSANRDFEFLEAVLFEKPRLPFAIVHYAVQGSPEEMGLRLDLDKQVFLDHFEDSRNEALATAAAPEIVGFLGSAGETAAGVGALS